MKDDALKGKTALVTGGAKRIGRAISLALAQEGANIVIHYNSSSEEADSLRDELAGRGTDAWVLKADFERPEEYATLIGRARDAAGPLDILINNASIFVRNTLKEAEFSGLMRHMQVNAWVPFVLSREFAGLEGRGRIINLIDARIKGYDWMHVEYILSKHVLSVLTEMTALEFAPDITVNGVNPGLILPPPGKDESYLDPLVKKVPLKKHGSPEDIASAVVYLLKNDFLTGTVIDIDGGRHLMEHANGPHPDK